ncbi:glycoside hydrolase family 38 protein [Dacryopinax primogenitus]|uniref:Alpha-mannosidase n=1 Tax=Dacryopinax primogenitus (strain DJM 731) TaxID=1858805 RepID=M5G6Z9_DACPD|nr:glycoside hydrolase family 38 protein [Dacryopinax primogenitus]EJU04489.1 glycoside hydrolase family 38 protein [Dacryopinax primogenitus]
MPCGHAHHQPGYPELNFAAQPKWIKSINSGRLDQFVGGAFASINLSSALVKHRTDDIKHVKLEVWSAPGRTKPDFAEAVKQTFKPAKKGDSFGPSWTNHWFRVTLNVPKAWANEERVQFEFNPNCEAMIWTKEGLPLQGITGGDGGDHRWDYILDAKARSGEHIIYIESSCNGMFGIDGINPPSDNRYYWLNSADIVVPNTAAVALMRDFQTLKEIRTHITAEVHLSHHAQWVANEIMNVWQRGGGANALLSQEELGKLIEQCRKLAEEIFGEGWREQGEKVYEGKEWQVWGIGHCHIDTAWLWPYSVTQQKVARSWSTQVDLMERYPEHRFAASSAQQYKWLEQLYPPLFEKVKRKIISGQFHTIGGQWLESDVNMPSGEALCRQFLYGQRYFESRFGARNVTSWLPDSFGYTGSLPQILRLSGMKYFFTQKLSWNNINKFPHTTFNWVGIDGSQVLVHMTPVDTYTAQATVEDVRKGITSHKNLEVTNQSLLVFGNGDGGGGPLEAMLENLRRTRAVANKYREVPLVKMGNTVEEFFEKLEDQTCEGKTLPNWHGEMYFEFHRGTYTSHGSIKKGNRKSEILLHDVEYVATLASLFATKHAYTYPKNKIDPLWEDVLLNQFHDVLPGSAIGMVYDDAERIYAKVAKNGSQLLEEAVQALFRQSVPINPTAPFTHSSSGKGKIIAINTLGKPRREVVEINVSGKGAEALKSQTVQISKNGEKGYVLVDVADGVIGEVKGMFAHVRPASAHKLPNGDFVLENSNVKMVFSKGRIISLYDIELQRELIPKGLTGGLIYFNDQPGYWDAWDVENHHLEAPHPVAFEEMVITENGPIRAQLATTVKIGKSTVDLTISLDAIPGSLKADARSSFRFDARVDWHQRHEILKFEIPLDIHCPNANFEMQFGYVGRPTHRNTTWEAAKFEVCGHKYADLSEFGYGVALLTESKYGYCADGQYVRISFLRGSTSPDAEQDQGEHAFSWAVYPHVGSLAGADVPGVSREFNYPLHLRYIPDGVSLSSVSHLVREVPFTIEEAPNVIIDTVKRGEDDKFDSHHTGPTTIVLRLYEAYGGHATAKLRISSLVPVSKAHITNILEDELSVVELSRAPSTGLGKGEDTILEIPFRGFQIVTVKLTLDVGLLSSGSSESGSPTREGWVKVARGSV